MRETIEQHFGSCKFQHKCQCITKNAFEFTQERQFFIYDEKNTEQPVKIISADEKFQLTVNNQNSKLICLIKTDNCLLGDDTRKCDCILFDDARLFFVEIKSSRSSTRSKDRRSAIEQLGITVSLFKQRIDISKFTANAIICFKQTEPRITSASANTARATFLQDYKVMLEERNYIDF